MLPVCFIHLPKTAGSSLQRVLAFNTMPQHVVTIYSNDMNYATMLLRRKMGTEIRELETVTPTLIIGHIGFGLLDPFGMSGTYLTLMREPISRCISEYNFAKENTHHHLHQTIHQENISLLDYFRLYPKWHTNLQARMLGGNSGGMLDSTISYDRMVASALINLDRISVFGIQERFADFLVSLSSMFPHFFIWNERINEGKYTFREALADDEARELEELNRADMELYKIVAERFEERVAQIINAEEIRDLIQKRTRLIESARELRLEIVPSLAKEQENEGEGAS